MRNVWLGVMWATVLLGSALMLAGGVQATLQWKAIRAWEDTLEPLLGSSGSPTWEMYAPAIAYTVAAILGALAPIVVALFVGDEEDEDRPQTGAVLVTYGVMLLVTVGMVATLAS